MDRRAQLAAVDNTMIKLVVLLAKVIATLDRILLPIKNYVNLVKKENGRIKTTKAHAKNATLVCMVLKQNKRLPLHVKMTVVLVRTLLLIKVHVLFAKKDNGKI